MRWFFQRRPPRGPSRTCFPFTCFRDPFPALRPFVGIGTIPARKRALYRRAHTLNHKEQIGSELLSSCSRLLMRLFILSKASSAKRDPFASERGFIRHERSEGSRQARYAQLNCSKAAFCCSFLSHADQSCVFCCEVLPFLAFPFPNFTFCFHAIKYLHI